MTKLHIVIYFFFFFSFLNSQSLVNSDFEGKEQDFFENYFKSNIPNEIEGIWVFSNDDFITFFGKVAIVKSGDRFLEILLEGGDRNGQVIDVLESKNDKIFKDYNRYVDFGPYYSLSSKSGGKYETIAYYKNDLIQYIRNDEWDLKRKFKRGWSTIGEDYEGKRIKNYNSYRPIEEVISFNLDSDEYYFEKSSELKNKSVKLNNGSSIKVFSEVERIKINDNVYKLYATGDYYNYYQIVWFNKSNKIVLIEDFIVDGQFDYPYEDEIKSLYDKLGKPKKSYSNELIENKIISRSIDEAFEWNVLFKNNSATEKVGKISDNIIYRSYLPTGKEYTSTDVENNEIAITSLKIAEGFTESYKKNGWRLREKIGEDEYDRNLQSLGGDVLELMLFKPLDIDNPKDYINSFNIMLNMMYNNFTICSRDGEDVTFSSLDDSTIAIAVGMDNNCKINMLIDINKWNKSSFEERLFIMFHELGHDVLNLRHNEGIRMMATNKYELKDSKQLGEIIEEMFSYFINNKDVESTKCQKCL